MTSLFIWELEPLLCAPWAGFRLLPPQPSLLVAALEPWRIESGRMNQ
ncbi:hypothetical protein [Rosistilla oblonga]|nr:hypothetical protein [Rosistilla oblonga]